ncbi:hypothetical protein AB0877_18645 [Micromonospora sp. NPDC047644]|uniref:hypothetical protein n=1 Tax=Micromonospora sp. NPDC047644 TaxID=3157203 RepID=UPI0034549C10
MPDQPFAHLFQDTEHLSWAPTEQVRERGRRRTRRTRIAAGLAAVVAVALVATGAVALAGGREGAPTPVLPATGSPTPAAAPTPTPSATPTPTPSTRNTPGAPPSSPSATSGSPSIGSTSPAIPADALLRAADLPSGFRAAGSDLDGDWSFNFAASYACVDTPRLSAKERAERGAVFRKPDASPVIERVQRYSLNGAKATIAWARTVTECKRSKELSSLSVVDSGFAGDGSLLIRFDAEGLISYTLFVRQGDLVAEVWLGSLTNRTEARRLAQRAADRLCAGTDAC